jgi:hypothetical protein
LRGHPQSVDALFEEGLSNMRLVSGKCMMDRNARSFA